MILLLFILCVCLCVHMCWYVCVCVFTKFHNENKAENYKLCMPKIVAKLKQKEKEKTFNTFYHFLKWKVKSEKEFEIEHTHARIVTTIQRNFHFPCTRINWIVNVKQIAHIDIVIVEEPEERRKEKERERGINKWLNCWGPAQK